MRKTLTSFTFSDGTCIPPNTYLASAASPRHYDDALYPAAQIFDGFRFSTLHENFHGGDSSGMKAGVRFQLTTATPEYLAWGYGRHACPGRFFAAVILKMLLGHVVLHYDVKLSDNILPQPPQLEVARLPSEVKLLIRRR
jgi:cytochrome P450